jgi:polyprenyl P-hydroxybenzoate/phenylacrylic acid decarboxylase-like protein
MRCIVVGITGATGAPLAVRVLQFLQDMDVDVHLVVSQWGRATLAQECGMAVHDLSRYAAQVHDARDLGASISSGSFATDGMIVVPCSMKTLAAIRMGYTDNLIARAADVTIKERRKLILVARGPPPNSNSSKKAGISVQGRTQSSADGPSSRSQRLLTTLLSTRCWHNWPKATGMLRSEPSSENLADLCVMLPEVSPLILPERSQIGR